MLGQNVGYTCEVPETSSYGIPVWRDKRGQPVSPLLLGKVWGRQRGNMVGWGGGCRMPSLNARYKTQLIMALLIWRDKRGHAVSPLLLGKVREGRQGNMMKDRMSAFYGRYQILSCLCPRKKIFVVLYFVGGRQATVIYLDGYPLPA